MNIFLKENIINIEYILITKILNRYYFFFKYTEFV